MVAGSRVWATIVAVAAACGDSRPVERRADAPPPRAMDAAAARPPADAGPPALARFAGGGDETAALSALGALPAWSAVIERDRLLARRHQRGVAFGLLGARDDGAGEWWLHDQTEGNGTLAIRVRLPAGLPVETGDRLAVWGAWEPVGERWVFASDRAETLAGGRLSPPPAPFAIASAPAPSEDALPVSQRARAGAIVFAIVGRPARFGDGWLVADRRDQPPVARLFLPGERRPYGAQTPPVAGEWWALEVGATYELEIARFRPPRQAGQLLVLQATTPPVRIEPLAAPEPTP